MTAPDDVQVLLQRIRKGDPDAARELLQKYEPEVRRIARYRLSPQMGRWVDSMDICQSVMGRFFVRVAAGAYEDIHDPQDLIRLVAKMAVNKVYEYYRKSPKKTVDAEELLQGLPADQQTPSQIVTEAEQKEVDAKILQEVHKRMTTEERYLAEQRSQGRAWTELATELGKESDALRMQYTRAVDRIAEELGLGGSDE